MASTDMKPKRETCWIGDKENSVLANLSFLHHILFGTGFAGTAACLVSFVRPWESIRASGYAGADVLGRQDRWVSAIC